MAFNGVVMKVTKGTTCMNNNKAKALLEEAKWGCTPKPV